MISKEKFAEIINSLRATRRFIDKINDEANELADITHNGIIRDFFDANSLVISNDHFIIDLLKNMFNDDEEMIEYWLYDLDFGRNYTEGSIQEEKNGKVVNIDVSTPEKLYDYLLENIDK